MNKEKLKEILEEINEICNSTNVMATADKRLEIAQKIYVSEGIEVGKNTRTEKISGNKKQESASEKQKKYLRDLNYKGDLNITKKEARDLIKKLKEEN